MLDKVMVVAGDRGGWNVLRPVLVCAADHECKIEVFFVGVCAKQSSEGQLEVDSRFNVTNNASLEKIRGASALRNNKVIVLGMSQSKEGLEAVLAAAIAASDPVFGIQDYYGSALPLLRALKKENNLNKINVLCVNDEIARENIKKEGFIMSGLLATGSPHFDQVFKAKDQWSTRRQELRKMLGLKGQEMIFLVVGQPNGTAEILSVLEKGVELAALQDQERILVRMHPRASQENQKAMEDYYKTTEYKKFILLPEDSNLSTDDLLPAADFVLSGYSTTNHIAVLYEMPGVIYVKTPSRQKDLMKDLGLEKPVEVEAGAAWYAATPQELAHLIQEVSSKSGSKEVSEIKQNQQKIIKYNDGLATQRCWQALKMLG